MGKELEPCRRCEGDNINIEHLKHPLNFTIYCQVTCLGCGESVQSPTAHGDRAEEVTKAEAIAAWNTRTPDPEARALLEAAAHLIRVLLPVARSCDSSPTLDRIDAYLAESEGGGE